MSESMDPSTNPTKKSLRDRELELDARSSGLDTRTDIDAAESLRIIFRSARYISLFWVQYITKFVLKLTSYALPLTLLPPPAKMLVDHVILGNPIVRGDDGYQGYPIFVWPFLDALVGQDVFTILVWLMIFGICLVVLIGSYTLGFEDEVEAGLAQGHDYATQVENKLHGGHSTAGGLYGYFEFKLNTRLTQSLNHTLRAELFSRITALPMTKLDDQRIGDSIYRVMYDTPQINEIFYEITHTPLMATTLYLYSMFLLWSAYSHVNEVVYITLAIFPLWVTISSLFSRVVRRRGQSARAAGALTTATIEEGMDNVLAVQSLGGNEGERDRFDEDSKESFFRYRMVTLLWIFILNLGGMLSWGVQIWFTAYIVLKVIDGQMTPGDFAAIMVFFGYLRGPAMAMSYLWIRFQDNVAAMRRVFALMDQPPESDLGSLKLETVNNGVELRNAGLVYPDGRRALDDVSFEAKIGEIVAFVGPTGSGKTSLAYLIPRYHLATEGEVLIDGINVQELTVESLRDQVTYVFQETQLFSDSILDNVRYGAPDASQEEVEAVAKIAGIHDFIESLPEGYETKLGTTTSKISVGQKQRLSIARGLLRESKILILDEPTSALDPETEKYLVSSLHEAAKNRLVIIIAHRLSTIANADKILFLDEGQVLEQGTHAELMERPGGQYRRFVNLQTTSETADES